MIKKYFSLLLILYIATVSAAFAAGDPMKSLFMFQQKMAEKGSPSAMMKMGEMYERGEGVDKSYDHALKMYMQAQNAGNSEAAKAIQRLKSTKNKPKAAKKREIEKQQKIKNSAAEKLQKQRNEAKAAKIKAEKEKAIKAKIAIQKAKAAKAKAAVIKAREAKAKAAAIKTKEDKAKAIAIRAKEEKAKAAAARVKAAKKRKEQEKKKEGFKSDPCKGKAARLLSICR